MISNDISNTETVRNVFIIDPNGVVRTILVYPMNVGRCIPEIIRTVQALQVADASNVLAPANWVPCEPVIMKSPQTFAGLLKRKEEIRKNQNGMSWYLSFEEPKGCCNLGGGNEHDRENKEDKDCRKEDEESKEITGESKENR